MTGFNTSLDATMANDKKKVLILGATVNQLPFVFLTKQRNHIAITMDNIPQSLCHKYSDVFANVSTVERELVLEYAIREKIDAIITCASDVALPSMAYVSEKLGLPSVSLDSVTTTVNKGQFRAFLLEHDFHTPQYHVFSDVPTAMQKMQTLTGKWILKPTDSSGSKGIYFIDFSQPPKDLQGLTQAALGFSRTHTVIIEEFIEGINCSIDGFINNGHIDKFCITNKLLTPLPYRTPIAHILPSKLSAQEYQAIKAQLVRILGLLKARTTPFDFDIVVDPQGRIFILEMSLRIGGNGIPKLIRYSEGYDLYDAALACALGEPISAPSALPPASFTGVFLICSETKGKLKAIASKAALEGKYGTCLKEVIYDIEVGDDVEAFISGNHRLGHFILQCESEEKLLEMAQQFKTDLAVRVG